MGWKLKGKEKGEKKIKPRKSSDAPLPADKERAFTLGGYMMSLHGFKIPLLNQKASDVLLK